MSQLMSYPRFQVKKQNLLDIKLHQLQDDQEWVRIKAIKFKHYIFLILGKNYVIIYNFQINGF
jgi:hypothetical protein